MNDHVKTCLIVDDSKIVRKVSRRILETFHYTVSEAEHGEDALNQCKQAYPDLIMLDWHMPVMDGLAFITALRALEGGDKPVVVFCTTESDFSRIQAAIMAGANEYVMKPFDEEIIRGKLEQLGLLGQS